MTHSLFFIQRDHKKTTIVAIVYTIVLIIFAIFIAINVLNGNGIFGSLDFLGQNISSKIFGLVLGSPIFIALYYASKITTEKIEIQFEKYSLIIKGKEKLEIAFDSIESMKINDPRVNTLNLYSYGKLLYSFYDGENNGGEKLQEIADTISHIRNFQKFTQQKKIFGEHIYIYTYKKHY